MKKPLLQPWLSLSMLLGLVHMGPGVSHISAFDDSVHPIAWSKFTEPFPTNANAQLEKDCHDRALKFYTTTWYNTTKAYAAQTSAYLEFKGIDEAQIRPPAAVAYAEAVALTIGIYNPAFTGVSRNAAMAQCKKLLTSVAHGHLANTAGGWGNVWQSGLWATFVGTAGWLLWDSLSVQDQQAIQKMVVYEANRYMDKEPDYASKLGTLMSDTKAEENAWNAGLLGVAFAMMPDHENAPKWKYRLCQWSISAYARPSDDTTNKSLVNGKAVKDWIAGYNIKEDGLLYNHNIMHPDYVTAIQLQNNSACILTLANILVPRACLFNFDVMYKVLVDYKFDPAKGFFQPGGTIYREGTDTLYWPQGTDWGRARRDCYALVDAQASVFGYDSLVTRKAAYWENLHAGRVKEMQDRFADGHSYGDQSENTYFGREEAIGATGCTNACLAYWARAQKSFSFTNESYLTLTVSVSGKPAPAVTIAWPSPNQARGFDVKGVMQPMHTGKTSAQLFFLPITQPSK